MTLSLIELHPSELIFKILEQLEISDIFKFCASSPTLWLYWKDDYLWKLLLKRDFEFKENFEVSQDIYYMLCKKRKDKYWLITEDGKEWTKRMVELAVEVNYLNIVRYLADINYYGCNLEWVLLKAMDNNRTEIVDFMFQKLNDHGPCRPLSGRLVIEMMKRRYTDFILKHIEKITIDNDFICAAYDNGYRESLLLKLIENNKLNASHAVLLLLKRAILKSDERLVKKICQGYKRFHTGDGLKLGWGLSKTTDSDMLMIYGVKGGNMKIMEMIMKIDIYYPHLYLVRPTNYNWALTVAAAEGNQEMVNLFLTPGKYIDGLNEVGATKFNSAMIEAIKNGHLKVATILLNKIESNLKNEDYQKALNCAKEKGYQVIVDILMDRFYPHLV